MSSLVPPWDTSEVAGPYGEVPGSKPNWQTANFHDKGRNHVRQASQLGDRGFSDWYSSITPRSADGRRHIVPERTGICAEPAATNGHPTYYLRRARSDVDINTAYRRALKHVPEPHRRDRPDRKRYLEAPQGGPVQPSSIMRVGGELQETQYLPEPMLPRLGRPSGISGLRGQTEELEFERYIGRRGKTAPGQLRNSGRAGDLSLTFGPQARCEDDPRFFKTAKDSPTFLRYCSSLPAPSAVSPLLKHSAGERRRADLAAARERQEVAALRLWPDEQR